MIREASPSTILDDLDSKTRRRPRPLALDPANRMVGLQRRPRPQIPRLDQFHEVH